MVQGDIEIPRVHELAHDPLDRGVELVEVFGGAGRGRDLVESRADLLGVLALRDVRDASSDEAARRRREADQANLARKVPAGGVDVPPLEDGSPALERLA